MLAPLLLASTLLSLRIGCSAQDLVRSPSLHDAERIKRDRFLVDEVADHGDPERPASVLTNNDDYSDFNSKPVENRASHKLHPVTFRPILPTYSTPRPVPRESADRATAAPVTVPPINPAVVRRVGYYFQHYPYDRMHRFFNLNPRLQFTYPKEYENIDWSYPIERTPYYHQRQFYNLAALGFYGKRK